MLLKRLWESEEGGANLDYAIFVAIFTLLLSSGLYAIGIRVPDQVAVWKEDKVEIDETLTGSIGQRPEEFRHYQDDKTYRIFKLPAGLQQKQ